MPKAKIALGMRVAPHIKEAMGEVARQECRTVAGLVEMVLTEYLRARGALPQPKPFQKQEGAAMT